jgi:hypothetical protein
VVAKRITRCKDYRMAPDLISETYKCVNELKHPQDNEEFVKWFSKCMKNYFQWPNSSFNKLYSSKESSLCNPCIGINVVRYEPVDEDAQASIEIYVEETSDQTKELLEMSSSIGKIKALKYVELLEFKRTLPAHENILFDLYFEKEQSTREIAKLYSSPIHKMNYQSVNRMINVIKEKIKRYKWKDL